MTHYQQLSTEKYYRDAQLQELQELQLQKNRQSAQALGQFLFATIVFLFTLTAVHQMPVWLPLITAFFG